MKNAPLIAVISFPGNNCEVESMRAVRKNGMEPLYFRWNDDRAKLKDVNGYFIVGGFSYEDRGRSGMVAGRDPLMDFIGQEAEKGKVVIGNCNGAQILVESGLIPLGKGLQMSLARNAVEEGDHWHAPGFLSEWVWITASGGRERSAASDWEGAMHLPIAHGEGRFTTSDKDFFAELKKNKQIAFSYCDEHGKVSEEMSVTPNGSTFAAAGICNPAGNVIALMPHPERTDNGDPYFASVKRWIESGKTFANAVGSAHREAKMTVPLRAPRNTEIFIDTIITNNEERTIEQTAKRLVPSLKLKQWKYLSLSDADAKKALTDLTIFNPNKERAFIRRGSAFTKWDAAKKREEAVAGPVLSSVTLLRRDVPDTGAEGFAKKSETGICYGIEGINGKEMQNQKILEIFCNTNAGTLEKLE